MSIGLLTNIVTAGRSPHKGKMGAKSLKIIMGGLPFALHVMYSGKLAQNLLENPYMHLPYTYLPLITNLPLCLYLDTIKFLSGYYLSSCLPSLGAAPRLRVNSSWGLYIHTCQVLQMCARQSTHQSGKWVKNNALNQKGYIPTCLEGTPDFNSPGNFREENSQLLGPGFLSLSW